MAVFRVERNTGYTVMSNHHLRNKDLTLKAKGLLSQMLSLPEDWDFTLAGLSYINRESIDAIRTAIWELEKAGYIKRHQGRDERGKMTAIEYVIYEQPQPLLDLPILESPTTDNPILENPTSDKPTSENPTQINKDILNTNLPKKDKSITDLSNTDSIPILSQKPFPFEEDATELTERKGKEAATEGAVEIYREIIKDNIDYDILIHDNRFDTDRIDEILDLILETVCTARKTLRIAGDDYPAELVKSKFLKLDHSHIEFVLDCMKQNTTKIRNIKQYLRAVLFNAPSTIDNYFYIVIDYSTEGENTVHFLNQVDEADLMAILAEEEITLAPAECTCTDKCAVGDIDTTCPVCIATMAECAGAKATPPADETNPPAGDDEQPSDAGGLNMGVVIAVIVVIALAGGGIFYYFKVLKPKQQKNKQPQGAELSELEYDEYDEDEEYTEALEDIADEMNYDTDETEDTEE